MRSVRNTSLYIHWPFCARICPYCDFNVHLSRGRDAMVVDAILRDMENQRGQWGARELRTVHFGGGTPSLLEPEQVGRMLEAADRLWGIARGAEVALEANPALLDRTKVEGFRAAGVNRLSLGVQSFRSEGLLHLGRDHGGEEARAVAELALDVVPNTSLDFIFGWRGQTEAAWRGDLATALELGAPHVSTYQLTVEEGTSFHRRQERGDDPASGADEAAGFYEVAAEVLEPAGLEHYEVSNFARPGHRSEHNLSYWRGHDYIGVGPGAHGRVTTDEGRVATVMPLHPADYARAPEPEVERLSGEDVAAEYVMMGLRTVEGVERERFRELTGRGLKLEGLESWFEEGGRLVATREGRRVLDALTAALLG